MPIRLYRCLAGHEEEEWFHEDYPKVKLCSCGSVSKAVPAPFAGSVDKESRGAAFSAKGLVPWERGMEQDAERNARYRLEAQAQQLSLACEDVVRNDPTIRPD
jgi:hypothetical protein